MPAPPFQRIECLDELSVPIQMAISSMPFAIRVFDPASRPATSKLDELVKIGPLKAVETRAS